MSGRGTRGQGRRGRSGLQRGAAAAGARRGSLPRSGLLSLCKMGRTSVRRLTPELRTAAPLPPLLPARTPLVQRRAAAAATPAAVIRVAYPHRSCGRGRSRDKPRQRRPAPECRPAPPRPNGAEPALGPAPRPDRGQGAGRAPDFLRSPRHQAVGANGTVGRERSYAQRGLYLGGGGADSGDVRLSTWQYRRVTRF